MMGMVYAVWGNEGPCQHSPHNLLGPQSPPPKGQNLSIEHEVSGAAGGIGLSSMLLPCHLLLGAIFETEVAGHVSSV